MKLYIGNKNYSSWSMRPWVLLREAGIPFEEVMVRFDDLAPGSPFKTALAAVSPTGRVPVLIDGGVTVWDSLAIAEYVAERYPVKRLWPRSPSARAAARSLCAEMHSGFAALRQHCPMNIEALLPEVGPHLLRKQAALRTDLERVTSAWSEMLSRHGGPLLFGHFTVADAFFAPVVTRIVTYSLPVSADIQEYIAAVTTLSSVAEWTADALAEKTYVEFDEPYREPSGALRPGVLS
jgi:glutathione S-transferase